MTWQFCGIAICLGLVALGVVSIIAHEFGERRRHRRAFRIHPMFRRDGYRVGQDAKDFS
jgi:hypothetical protein